VVRAVKVLVVVDVHLILELVEHVVGLLLTKIGVLVPVLAVAALNKSF
jgi:hypothetical protein